MTDAFLGTEGGNQLVPSYAYIIRYEDTGDLLCLTAWERPFSITGLPADFGAADPQVFSLAQITHGEHGLSAEFENKPLTVMLTTQNTVLASYFATATATRIKIIILRCNSQKLLTGDSLDYDVDCMLLNSGLLGAITIDGLAISASVTPEPFGQNANVPRHYWSRACGYVLGAAGTCGIDLSAYTHAATLDEVAAGQKIVTLNITPPGGNAEYFRSGVLVHDPTGQRAGIDWSDGGGVAGKTRLKLRLWNLNFQPGDVVSVIAGCRHNPTDCETKFSNLARYGGYPYIPTRNPTIYGVGL